MNKPSELEKSAHIIAKQFYSDYHGGNIAQAIFRLAKKLESPNECDANLEVANVVDGLFFIGRGLFAIAKVLEQKKNENKLE